MRPLPPGWPEVIPGLPLLFVFIGSPDCFIHAKREKSLGFFNHVALASIQCVFMHQWTTADRSVIVILFHRADLTEEAALVATLLADKPKEVLLRYWPGQHVIRCTP